MRRSAPAVLGSLLVLLAVLAMAVGSTTPVTAAPSQASPDARATIADTELEWGESTTVRATGFAPGSTVFAVLYPGATELFRGQPGSDGSVTGTVTAPSGLASSTAYQLVVQGVAEDGGIGYVGLPLTILGPTPLVEMSSTELSWGETVTVRGERYHPGSRITVSLFPDNTLLGAATADSSGRFSTAIMVPDRLRSATDYQVAITGQGIDQLFHFDTIEVAIIGDRPVISLDRDRVRRGDTLTATGQPFFVGTEVQVVLLPGFEALGTVPVEPDGTFTATVRIPEDAFAADPHLVVVTGMGADGLFAYATAVISIDGAVGSAGSTGSTVSTLAGGVPVTTPEFDRFVDRFLGAPPATPRRGSSGPPGWLLLLVLLVLLVPLVLSRRDVRRSVRRSVRRRVARR
jgi:hypothetical protein